MTGRGGRCGSRAKGAEQALGIGWEISVSLHRPKRGALIMEPGTWPLKWCLCCTSHISISFPCVSISGMSSQGQALSRHSLLQPLPLLLPTLLSVSHLPLPTLCLYILLSFPPPCFFPLSSLSSVVFSGLSLVFSSLSFSLFSLSLTLSLCLYLSLPLPPPTPAPTGALCVLKLCGWQPESTPPHPPTHAQLGRSSHSSATLPSHHPASTVTALPSAASAVPDLPLDSGQLYSGAEATKHSPPSWRSFPFPAGRAG